MERSPVQSEYLIPFPSTWRERQWATALGLALIAVGMWTFLYLVVVGAWAAPKGDAPRFVPRAHSGGLWTTKAAEPPDQVYTEGVE